MAIGDYPESSGWRPIASLNDVKFIKGALINKGFREKDIDTLKNSQATKAAILQALDNIAAKASANDIVVIHFSSHGQQIQDQATVAEGKDEEDGFDEAIIPYDAEALYNYSNTGYDGSKHLRDDDLAVRFKAIRNKIKPNGSLLVLLDACHSGTASRAFESSVARGTPIPFVLPGFKQNASIQIGNKGGEETFFAGDGTDSLSNMIVISASAPSQPNFQTWDDNGKDVGALSFAFAKAMNDMQPGDDYQLLFEKIKARIQAGLPTQIPMIEGNTAQEVLGARFNKPSDEIILSINKADKKEKEDSVFVINKGALSNITKGSTCKIFIAGKKEPIAEGRIEEVGTFQSVGVANKLLPKEEAYRATIEQVSYGDFSTSIVINEKNNANGILKNQVNRLFQSYQFISVKDNAEMILDIAPENGKVKMELLDRADSTRWEKEMGTADSLSQEDKEALIKSIKNAIRVKYLRSLPDGGLLGNSLQAKITAENNNEGGELMLHPGDKYTLSITNNSKENLFFSIVDIMPDNQMKVLIPTPSKEPQDFSIDPKQSRTFPVRVDAITPSGKEVFKIFITREPIDLRRLFDRNNKRSERGITMSLEDMIDDTFKDSDDVTATRSTVSSVKLDEAGILTVGFTIKKEN